jgi:hypothetical protein
MLFYYLDKVLVMQMATQRWMNSWNAWKADSYSDTDGLHSLNYSYPVKCDEHYYGDGCANLCRPRDDKFGHYTCSEPNGDKVCLPGWSGEYCSKGKQINYNYPNNNEFKNSFPLVGSGCYPVASFLSLFIIFPWEFPISLADQR